jgi:hypothetical protein
MAVYDFSHARKTRKHAGGSQNAAAPDFTDSEAEEAAEPPQHRRSRPHPVVGPEETEDNAAAIAEAKAALAAQPAGKRVQLRVPLDNVDEAIGAMAMIILAAERSMRALQSWKKQRHPDLIDPLANARAIFERTNKALNCKRRGR